MSNDFRYYYEATMTVLVDPNTDEYDTLTASSDVSEEEAKIALAKKLHQDFFGQDIDPDDREKNCHDYTTPLGFLECCQRGFEDDDFRPTANSIWNALQEAHKTLQVTKKQKKQSKKRDLESEEPRDDKDKSKKGKKVKSQQRKEREKAKRLTHSTQIQ